VSNRLTSLIAAAVTIPLAYLYLSFLVWLVNGATFLPSDAIQAAVVVTAAIRVLVILSVKRLRKAEFILIVDILSLEILFLPFLAVAYILFHTPWLPSTMTQIAFTWPLALLLVFPVFAIYKIATLTRDGSSLTMVLPSAAAMFTFLAVLESVTKLTPQGSGLSGLSVTLASALVGGVASAVALPGVALAGVVLYVALMVYAASRARPEGSSWNPMLALAVIGTLVALGWSLLASDFTGLAVFALGIPAAAILAAVWVVTRVL